MLNLMDMGEICDGLGPILRLVGIALKLIQYAVPILLIVIGSIDFAKATIGKDEKEIKEAQGKFLKRGIVALCVFLIVPIVNVLMSLVVTDDGYQDCLKCVKKPFSCKME